MYWFGGVYLRGGVYSGRALTKVYMLREAFILNNRVIGITFQQL